VDGAGVASLGAVADADAAVDGVQLTVDGAGGDLDAAVDLADVVGRPGRGHGQQQAEGDGGEAGLGHGGPPFTSVRAMGPRLATIRTCLKSLDLPGVPHPRERRQAPGPGPQRSRGAWRCLPMAAALALACAGLLQAQERRDPGTAERELRKVRAELQEIARERRRLENQRGDAATRLRRAEEQLGRTARELAETEAALQRETEALADLERRRDQLRAGQEQGRRRLAELLRASYALGGQAPLK